MATRIRPTAERAPPPLVQALLHRLHRFGPLGITKGEFWIRVKGLIEHHMTIHGIKDELDKDELLRIMKDWGVEEDDRGFIKMTIDPPPYPNRPTAA